VKVNDWFAVPTLGVSFGKVKAKVPFTLAMPLLKTELLNDCPKVIELAVGAVVIVGVAFATVTVTFVVVVV
jgi:hypothetical protein